MTNTDQTWTPSACTLPAAERPVRVAEFGDLFGTALREQHRIAGTRLRWRLDPAAESTARDLTARETACCSFFTFTFTATADALELDVTVPAEHVAVLDALAAQAAARMRQ